MSLGEKLCNGRLAMKQTTSEVAAATRMKVQTVEYLEREEFNKIPAPIYAKGFIKLYAEHVGLDPQPLIDEYMGRFQDEARPSLTGGDRPRVRKLLGESEASPAEPAAEEADLFDQAAAPSDSAAPAAEQAPRPGLADLWSHAAAGSRRLLQSVGSRFRKKGDDQAPRERGIPALNRLGWRAVAGIAGVLVVMALLASMVSQCSRRPDVETPVVSTVDEKLRLAIEPPDPYFD